MKILVTGGCGFVGSALVRELVKKGNEVTVFDRNEGYIKGVEYIKGDITKMEDVRETVKGKDYVYHLAAILDETCPKKLMFDVNVGGTVSVLEACRREPVKKLIYLSTAGVMAETKEPANESTPYGPRTNYEKSKALAERTVLEYYKRYKLPVVIIRPALLYGPNKYWKEILKAAMKGFPIIGSGKNKWHMLYIKNLIPVLVRAKSRGKPGEIYIIADEKVLTYEEMYRIIREELGVKKEPRHVPVWLAKLLALLFKISGKRTIVTKEHIERLVKNKYYDISKAKKDLNYYHKYDFRRGIRETIEYFKPELQVR
ncbi:MAG TPA: NAD(P)-dependent oxidoreductase [Candidatus Aenigmarchaeota archaeon]|nr:NAD(P)-dependent oxidoreductase [Candidatus Aenigmarchaeota archaeon]